MVNLYLEVLTFSAKNELDLTSTLFCACKGGISHTHNGIGSRNNCKRIDNILTRQAHQHSVHDVKAHPLPPPRAKVDSDHSAVYAKVNLRERFAPNRRVRNNTKCRQFEKYLLRFDFYRRDRVIGKINMIRPSSPTVSQHR